MTLDEQVQIDVITLVNSFNNSKQTNLSFPALSSDSIQEVYNEKMFISLPINRWFQFIVTLKSHATEIEMIYSHGLTDINRLFNMDMDTPKEILGEKTIRVSCNCGIYANLHCLTRK